MTNSPLHQLKWGGTHRGSSASRCLRAGMFLAPPASAITKKSGCHPRAGSAVSRITASLGSGGWLCKGGFLCKILRHGYRQSKFPEKRHLPASNDRLGNHYQLALCFNQRQPRRTGNSRYPWPVYPKLVCRLPSALRDDWSALLHSHHNDGNSTKAAYDLNKSYFWPPCLDPR